MTDDRPPARPAPQPGPAPRQRAPRGCVAIVSVACSVAFGCSADEPSSASDDASAMIADDARPSTDQPTMDASSTSDVPDVTISDTTAADTAPIDTTAGDVTEAVDADVPPSLPPLELDEVVVTDQRVSLEVVDISSVVAEAQSPGEVGGAALLITIEIVNDGSAAFNLSDVTVNLFDGVGNVASPLVVSPADPFSGSLASGDTATGAYLFSFDGRPDPITVEISPSVGEPVAIFRGPRP